MTDGAYGLRYSTNLPEAALQQALDAASKP